MKRELIYAAAVGGCVGALMTVALGWVLPLGAQSDSDIYFRKVTCGALEVVRPDGTPLVSIGVGETAGWISVKGEQQFLGSRFYPLMVSMGGNEQGGYVVVSGEQGKGKAKMEVNERQ